METPNIIKNQSAIVHPKQKRRKKLTKDHVLALSFLLPSIILIAILYMDSLDGLDMFR